jgi:hypothetical protein
MQKISTVSTRLEPAISDELQVMYSETVELNIGGRAAVLDAQAPCREGELKKPVTATLNFVEIFFHVLNAAR